MKPTAQLALDWATRSFGYAHVSNIPMRALRLAEEAVELAQAAGVPEDTMRTLVNLVYSRPSGDLRQEIGGVMMTITVLCATLREDTDYYFEEELRRVLSKPVEHFTQRNQEKVELGLTVKP